MTEPLSMDQAFIRKLTEIVLANLTNENFTVKKLAKETGMSHANLYRRLKAIKNQDVSQFVREIRLRKAMELLHLNAGTTSEVAFMVGFGSPAYFIKCFREYYGFAPGEVRRNNLIQPDQKDLAPVGKGLLPGQEQAASAAKPVSRLRVKLRIIGTSTAAVIVVLLLFLFLFIPKLKEYNRSVVVLPFKDLSEKPGNQHLADGIMEDILNSLFQISELRVISRTTSEYFRGKDLPVKKIARSINARYILESSVRRYDNKLRITLQLIDAELDQHLWSENIDRDLTDIISLQGIIATQVALRLKVAIPDTELGKIEKVLTKSPEAYDNYLRGRFLLNKATDEQRIDISKEGLTGSIQYFEKAVAADSNFAEAYACLASAFVQIAGWGWHQSAKEGFLKAKELSIKALEINPDCAQAHAVKGSVHIYFERNFEEGRKELLLSLKSSPPFPPVYQKYAQLLMITGPIEEARIYMDRALELEPYYWVLHNLNAWIYYFEGKHIKAINACQAAQNLKSDYIYTNWLLFLNYAKLGEGERAAEELKTIVRLSTGAEKFTEEINEIYKMSGIKGLFKWLTDININKPVPAAGLSGHPFFIAWWYAILGDREKSIYWLERNMETKIRLYEYFNLIATNPDFDILRDDPRFLTIIDKIGLTPYNTRKAR